MDIRNWPWKKKPSSSGKQNIIHHASSNVGSAQISTESDRRLTELEDEVEDLNRKLLEAHSEIINKENLVKQHGKVAEEAVSGWEKAEEETAMLRNQLESVTLLKVTAEDQASHLDGALKECMMQIRDLNQVIVEKAVLFEEMKIELESHIDNLGQELLASAAENAAVSRSLQDRSDMLLQVNEEKLQSESEIELLKSNLHSCKKEVSSLEYELHIARKEVEIRNEERNMSVRSAEAANKQYLEVVKKIAKLEGECERLRSLVRKKLPGPAAMAQMKLEVENMNRGGHGESHSRLRRSSPTTQSSQLPEFSMDIAHKYQKIAIDEETKMLKEALANRNSELQESRSKLRRLEAQLQVMDSPSKSENMNHADLMDDFLEMERLASNGTVSEEASLSEEFETSLCHIYNFVMDLGKEAKCATGTSATGLKKDIDMFCAKYGRTISSGLKLVDFVIDVARVISKISGMCLVLSGYGSSEVETNSPDCVDKIALQENKTEVGVDSLKDRYPNCSANFPDSASNPDTPHENNVPISESAASTWKYSSEEFEQLKMEKDNLVVELSGCRKDFEATRCRLIETERLLSEAKSQLLSAEKSNSLAGTQLKCMAESYRMLETLAEDRKVEINLLQGKVESFETELQVERRNHRAARTRCQDLMEQLQSVESENVAVADTDDDNSQEEDLATAAEKLAECQETIFLLSKQLKTMRPQTDFRSSPRTKKHKRVESSIEDSRRIRSMKIQEPNDPFEMESPAATDLYNVPLSPSNSQANDHLRSPKQSKHRHTRSDSASVASPITTPVEKQGRAFSRLFTLKGKKPQ